MKFIQALSISAFILTIFVINECQMIIYNKMTNAVCESLNKSWVTFEKCRLRAISRSVTKLNVEVTFLHPANDIHTRLELQKKANGYKPWLWDYTIDSCAFMRQRRHPVVKLFYNILRDYSTINHTCPYVGKQSVRDFYYDPANLTLPIPSGDYLLILTWMFDGKPQFITKVYFLFHQDIFRD